jgi:hypothetical protein
MPRENNDCPVIGFVMDKLEENDKEQLLVLLLNCAVEFVKVADKDDIE